MDPATEIQILVGLCREVRTGTPHLDGFQIGREAAPVSLRQYARIATPMEQSELFEEWQRNKDRPQYARNRRNELADYLTEGVIENLPEGDASTFAWRVFLDSHMGTVTRQLNPENAEGGDSDNTDGGETSE